MMTKSTKQTILGIIYIILSLIIQSVCPSDWGAFTFSLGAFFGSIFVMGIYNIK